MFCSAAESFAMRRQHTATATVVHRSNMMTESERWDRTAAAIDKYRVTPQLIEIIALALSLSPLSSSESVPVDFADGQLSPSRQDAIALSDLVHHDKQMASPPETE